MTAKLLLYCRGLEEGGAEKRMACLALGLNGPQFQVGVGYSDHWGPVGDRLTAAGIPLVRFPARDAAAAERAIRGFAPDVVHTFSHLKGVELTAAAAAGVPLVAATRVDVRHWDDTLQLRDWECERNAVTDRITAVSHAAAALYAKVDGIPLEQIAVIHNGIDIPEDLDPHRSSLRRDLGLAPGVTLVGYVANYRPEKDHETLLRAFRLVLDTYPATYLLCCGIRTPERERHLSAMVRDLALEGSVTLLPSQTNVGNVYRALDVYVHSSRFEGFSNSLVEAMAYGLPVVATAAGGTPEAVVEDATGLLVPPGDAVALAGALGTLLADAGKRREFGAAGRLRAIRHFSAAQMVSRYAAWFTDALIRNPRRMAATQS